MNATRLYTLKYGQNRQVLSIGRVQTPTLALIVNRQLEIDNFEPKQYWELKTIYRNTQFTALVRKSEEEMILELEKIDDEKKKAQRMADNKGMDPIKDRESGEALLARIKKSPFTIIAVSRKTGTRLHHVCSTLRHFK
jgi:Topoisomerase IA